MRRKSLTNSHWRTNSLAVYESYRDDIANDKCELAWYLGVTWKDSRYVPLCKHHEVNAEPGAHHIFSQHMRPNMRSNLIRISHEAHRLVHNGIRLEPKTIRLACIFAKIVKADDLGDPSEFDLEEINKAAGLNVAGWIENQTFEIDWQIKLQSAALARLTSIQGTT